MGVPLRAVVENGLSWIHNSRSINCETYLVALLYDLYLLCGILTLCTACCWTLCGSARIDDFLCGIVRRLASRWHVALRYSVGFTDVFASFEKASASVGFRARATDSFE